MSEHPDDGVRAAVLRGQDAEAAVARVEALADWFERQHNWKDWGIHAQIRAALRGDA